VGLDIIHDCRTQHSAHVCFVIYAQLLELPMNRRRNEHGNLSVPTFGHNIVIWVNPYLGVSVLPCSSIYTSTIIWAAGGIHHMAESFIRRPIDFVFDFATVNVSAGEEVRTGEPSYGYEVDGRAAVKNYELDNESIMEIEGIEIMGPNNVTYREKLKAVRLVIDGKEHNEMSFNEQMCPAMLGGALNTVQDFRDGYVCTNLGRGMLAGGDPANATPKVGPGQDLLISVNMPRLTEGGAATVSTPMRVRLHTIQIRGEPKLNEVLEHYGHLTGGNVNQSWTMGDLENTMAMPLKTVEKTVGDGAFGLADWTSLHGGNEADLPYIENYITYAQNSAATTPNAWYQFTMEGQRVDQTFQELNWNFTQRDALKLTHVGMMTHNNTEWVRLWKDGKPKVPEFRVTPATNALLMPQGRWTNTPQHNGPTRLGRSYWVWNEHGAIELKDNGTAVPAWAAAPTTGAMLAVWGKRFHLRGTE